ncbi:MAG: Glycolate dehydrogenase, FAD-binding subunit GlcE, partial [uncultured Thermomicrobiales bacterium]
MPARSISTPAAAYEVAEVLRTASDLRQGVVPFGGGLSLGTGNVTEPVEIGLDLNGLRGVSSYHPADLTLSVGAGTTFAEIAATLSEQEQELPIDVPFPERATIGGLIATGFAGPRRLAAGSLKDLLIGCEFVRGDGLLAKAGGMVVKNVSGFEIPRLLHGSWGSLAVLTSVNLKVVPAPKSEATLVLAVESLESGLEQAIALLASEPGVSACTLSRAGDATTVAVRCMGRDRAVGAMIAGLETHAARCATEIDMLHASGSRLFWQAQVEEWAVASSDVVVTIATRPRHLGTVAALVQDRFRSSDGQFALIASPGTGSIRFRLESSVVAATELRAWWDSAALP